MKGDSLFSPGEKHEATVVAEEGKRKGWKQTVDTVRFGAYSISVTRRIDPATGSTAPVRSWGDSFFGFIGKKPASYMASNWSPWDFMSAAIRLEGDAKGLPSPTFFGKVVFCGLREAVAERIVADVVFQDAAGGLLRLRCAGFKGTDRCALAVKYFPPIGKVVASLSYTLTCQPYDHSDRGHWDRRRWLTTPVRSSECAEKPVIIDTKDEWQFVLHNRFAQNDAGTFLAVDPDSVASVSVQQKGPINLTLTPKKLDSEMVFVLGDWVDVPYSQSAADFFTAAVEVEKELKDATALTVRPPCPPDPLASTDVDDLLKKFPVLNNEFGERVKAARSAVDDCARLGSAAGESFFLIRVFDHFRLVHGVRPGYQINGELHHAHDFTQHQNVTERQIETPCGAKARIACPLDGVECRPQRESGHLVAAHLEIIEHGLREDADAVRPPPLPGQPDKKRGGSFEFCRIVIHDPPVIKHCRIAPTIFFTA